MNEDATLVANPLAGIPLRLREIRQSAKMTKAQFAESLGISPRSYFNYEDGTRQAPINVLFKAARLSDFDLLWLLTGQPEVQIDIYDRAIVATMGVLEKENFYLPGSKMLVIARQAFELSVIKRTSVEDELPGLIRNVKDLLG
ncbi:helix-turn-helix domain-containing protein (plasmid) [Paracoccus marcusii]|uniref:helix-turn-helix domain-containing protein n=1 Tax=Paracoccus marcusii TaxID=59779 RepID=UPI0038B7DE0E